MNPTGMQKSSENEEFEEEDVEEKIRRILTLGNGIRADKKSIIEPGPSGTGTSQDSFQPNFCSNGEEIKGHSTSSEFQGHSRMPKRASSSKTRTEQARETLRNDAGFVRRSSMKGRPLAQTQKSLSFREPACTVSTGRLIPYPAGDDFYNDRRASGGPSYPSPSPSPNSGRVPNYARSNSKLSLPPSRQTSVRSNRSTTSNSSLRRAGIAKPRDPLESSFYRTCRSNSFAFSMDNGEIPLRDLPPKEQRHRKVGYCVIIFSSLLLMLAILCVVISLHFSSRIENKVRKENEDLLRMAQPASGLNITTTSMPFSAAAPLDTGDQSTSINNRTEGTAAGQGALTSNLQQPRQRALTTMLARLLQSSSAISTTIPPNTNTASNSARKYNKIASLTLKHPKNNTKTWSGTLPSSSPEPVAQKASIILEQLMMGHASYYETPRQVQNKELHPKNDRASETSIEDHDEAPPIILAAVVA